MENYEQKYKEALERAKDCYVNKKFSELDDTAQQLCEYVFPELRESEDERIRKAILHLVKSQKQQHFGIATYDNINWLDMIAWIEKQAEQKPAEWSEEDEKMWLQIINEMEAIKSNSSTIFEKHIAQDKIDWLKSLKPNHWKPSEEQMKALHWVAEYGNITQSELLKSLYNDLKSL